MTAKDFAERLVLPCTLFGGHACKSTSGRSLLHGELESCGQRPDDLGVWPGGADRHNGGARCGGQALVTDCTRCYDCFMRELRFPGESDAEFRQRVERTVQIAKILVDAALGNACIQNFIADNKLPYTLESVRSSPTVRIEYEQAIAIGEIGTCLRATQNKHWGAGPQVLPLLPDDPVDPMRILYLFKPESLYNRRFEQRMRMKELLGRSHRKLVGEAKYYTKSMFLSRISAFQAAMIRRIFEIEPGVFWRAAKGRLFLELPPRAVQLDLLFEDDAK